MFLSPNTHCILVHPRPGQHQMWQNPMLAPVSNQYLQRHGTNVSATGSKSTLINSYLVSQLVKTTNNNYDYRVKD